jgi:hypothetical protein
MGETKSNAKSGVNSKAEQKKRLALVGSAQTLAMAPYDDPNFEIWVHSTTLPSEGCKRADRVFEFHPFRYYGQPNVIERLTGFEGPVYMQKHVDIIPNSVEYPLKEIEQEFKLPCMGDELYVTNSITFMILLAIYEGYTDLNLFGVHMAHDTEYSYQLPSCSWALGLAQGRGCSLWLPKESSLLKARYLYGYHEPSKYMAHAEDRVTGLQKGIRQVTERLNQTAVQKAKTEGALVEAQYWKDYLYGYR